MVDCKGGWLIVNVVIVCNFLCELEFFLLLFILFSFGVDGVDGWINWLLLFWCMIFIFFLLFNKDKLWIGDFVVGMMVIYVLKV